MIMIGYIILILKAQCAVYPASAEHFSVFCFFPYDTCTSPSPLEFPEGICTYCTKKISAE